MSKAIFAKPNIPELKKQGYVCMDMHFHSRFSDGLSKISSIHKRCKKLGIGVALTDHNECKGALKIVKYKDIIAIPGIEITSCEGIHTLFYFYNPKELEEFHKKVVEKSRKGNPYSDLDIGIIEIVESAKRYNCKISTAHPFGPWNTGIHKFTKKSEYRKILKKIDFVEAINSSTKHHANVDAIKWAKRIGKPFTGGSDGHAACFLGNTVTCVKSRNVLDSMKKSLVVGTEVNPLLLTLRHLLKIRMFSKFPKFYIKKLMRETLKKE